MTRDLPFVRAMPAIRRRPARAESSSTKRISLHLWSLDPPVPARDPWIACWGLVSASTPQSLVLPNSYFGSSAERGVLAA